MEKFEKFGKYMVSDRNADYWVEVKHIILLIPKVMLNRKAKEIITQPVKGEEDIKAFLREYIKGLSQIQKTTEILISLK